MTVREDPEGAVPNLNDDEETLFGFGSGDDSWIELANRAEEPDRLGGIGSYEVIEEVDRGGQGVVYRARQPGTGRDIALKRLIAGSFSSRSSRDRFQREIEAAATLNHPGIVTLHGFEVVDGLPVMAMEWVEGQPINRWARPPDEPEKSEREVLGVFLELCAAISHAHQNGVLHRDLKPSNVLVTAEGHPRVLDFGLAKPLAPSGDVTVSGEFRGTPAYASPEQFTAEHLDVRSDVYSLGVILYEMLTGERPYRPEEGIRQFFQALEREESARLSTLRPDLSREIDWICARALAPERTERYQSVDALADDLQRYLAGEPVLAHPASALYQLKKFIQRNRLLSSLIAVLFAVILAGAIFYRHTAAVLEERADQVAAARDAEALTRARAEAARDAESVAREQAERARDAESAAREQAEHARDAEAEARAQLEVQHRTSLLAQRRALTILNFLHDDVLLAGDPLLGSPDSTIREALSHASGRIGERFRESPVIGAYVQRKLGLIHLRLGLYREAEELLREALATAEREAADLSEAGASSILGAVLCELGEYAEARELLEGARRILESHDDREQGSLWTTLHRQVNLYLDSGDLDAAEEATSSLLAHSASKLEEEPDRYCAALVGLGRLQVTRGEYGNAIATLSEAERLHREVEGPEGSDFGALLYHLAEAQYALGRSDAAHANARRALSVLERALPPDHPRTGEVLALLAHLTRDDAGESRAFAARATSIADAEGAPQTPCRARIRDRLADLRD